MEIKIVQEFEIVNKDKDTFGIALFEDGRVRLDIYIYWEEQAKMYISKEDLYDLYIKVGLLIDET